MTKLRRPPARHAVTLSTTPAVAARWLLPWVCLLRDGPFYYGVDSIYHHVQMYRCPVARVVALCTGYGLPAA